MFVCVQSPILQPGRYLVREGVLNKLYKRDAVGTGFFSSLARKEAPFIFFLLNDALLQAKKTTLSVKYTSVNNNNNPTQRSRSAHARATTQKRRETSASIRC